MQSNITCSHLCVKFETANSSNPCIQVQHYLLIRILPINIQALSLYSLCQETDSFTPRLASRSFSSLINFTFVSGLKTENNLEIQLLCHQLVLNTRHHMEVIPQNMVHI